LFLRLLFRFVEIQRRRGIARARAEHTRGGLRLAVVQPAIEKTLELLEMSLGRLSPFRRRPPPAATLFNGKPCGQESEAFGRTDRTSIADEQLLAIKTKTSNAKLHGVGRKAL